MTDDPEGDELSQAIDALAKRHGFAAVQFLAVNIDPYGNTLIRERHTGNIYLRFGVVSEWLAEAMRPEDFIPPSPRPQT